MPSKSNATIDSTLDSMRKLIKACTSFAEKYNPTRDDLKVPALTTLLKDATAAVQGVNKNEIALDNASDARVRLFRPFKAFSTRIMNALAVSGAMPETIDSARTIQNAIQGRRATPKKAAPVDVAEADAPKTISVSRQTASNQLSHFEKMLTILRAEPKYLPNEEELRIANLETLLQNMKDTYDAESVPELNLEAAYNLRNALFNDKTGLCDIAADVKLYVKSVFGASSNEYKLVRSFHFKKITAR